MLGLRHRLGEREALAVEGDGCGVFGDEVAGEILDAQAAVGTETDAQRLGGEAVRGRCDGDMLRARLRIDGPACILGHRTAAPDANAQDRISQRDDADRRAGGGDLGTV